MNYSVWDPHGMPTEFFLICTIPVNYLWFDFSIIRILWTVNIFSLPLAMVVSCSVFGCSNRKDRQRDVIFYRLPKIRKNHPEWKQNIAQERRLLWISQLGLKLDEKNLSNIRVCSRHFLSGKDFFSLFFSYSHEHGKWFY